MPNLNDLPLSNEAFDDNWEEPQGLQPLPKGTYIFRVAEVKADEQSNTFAPIVSLEVAEGDLQGRKLNFQRYHPSPFYRPPVGVQMDREARRRQPSNTSMYLDFLRAFGYTGGLRSLGLEVRLGLNDAGEDKKYVFDPTGAGLRAGQSVEGKLGKGCLDHEGYCKECHRTTVKGASNFVNGVALCNGYEEVGERINEGCGTEVTAREVITRWVYPKKGS